MFKTIIFIRFFACRRGQHIGISVIANVDGPRFWPTREPWPTGSWPDHGSALLRCITPLSNGCSTWHKDIDFGIKCWDWFWDRWLGLTLDSNTSHHELYLYIFFFHRDRVSEEREGGRDGRGGLRSREGVHRFLLVIAQYRFVSKYSCKVSIYNQTYPNVPKHNQVKRNKTK